MRNKSHLMVWVNLAGTYFEKNQMAHIRKIFAPLIKLRPRHIKYVVVGNHNFIIWNNFIKVKDMTKNEKRQNKWRIRGTDKWLSACHATIQPFGNLIILLLYSIINLKSCQVFSRGFWLRYCCYRNGDS